MSIASEELLQFYDAAERFIRLARFDALDARIIYVRRPDGNVVLRYRVSLTKGVIPREQFVDDPIVAVRTGTTAPAEALAKILEALEANQTTSGIGGERVRFLSSSGQPGPIKWNYHTERSHPVWCTTAIFYGDSIDKIIPNFNGQATDRRIARASRHEIASFSRLFFKYFGGPYDVQPSSSTTAELIIPWPVRDLGCTRQNDELVVSVRGLADLDTDRLVLNVEGPDRDRKFDRSTLRWAPGPETDGWRRFDVSVDGGSSPQRVNLYFEGLDEIHLTGQTQHADDGGEFDGDADGGEIKPIAKAKPVVDSSIHGGGMHVVGLAAKGFRSLLSTEIDLKDLTVVVGPNEAGKSTLLDAFSVLRAAAAGDLEKAINDRGGLSRMVTRSRNVDHIWLSVTLQADQVQLRYSFTLRQQNLSYLVAEEALEQRDNEVWTPLFRAKDGAVNYKGRDLMSGSQRELLLAEVRDVAAFPELESLRRALQSMALFPGFNVSRALDSPMRLSARPNAGVELDPLGNNLTAVLYAMHSQHTDDWNDYIGIVKLAFPNLADIQFPPAALGYIELVWRDDRVAEAFSASELSDGTLSFLASLAALFERRSSLVVIDEPEVHLHPEALYRLSGAAKALSERHPILLLTQSDRLLEYLGDRPEAVVVARSENAATVLIRPNVEDLKAWLQRFTFAEFRPELESWENQK